MTPKCVSLPPSLADLVAVCTVEDLGLMFMI
jgi:hypothetical protein